MIVRVLRESRQANQAVRRGDALIASCPDSSERDQILVPLIGSKLDLAAVTPQDRQALLAQATADETNFTPDAGIEAARVRLETAILTGNAAAALAAWKDYFGLYDKDAPQALEGAGATAIFANGLHTNASVDDRLKLADLLMRAGFADPSRRFAVVSGIESKAAGNPVWMRACNDGGVSSG